MNKKFVLTAAFGLMVVSGIAVAQCPSSLTAEQMADCIVKENAGYWYTTETSSSDNVPAKESTAATDKVADLSVVAKAHH